MFGIFYLLWAGISDLGYKFKAGKHDSNAHVDKHTMTYMGYDGTLRDALTGQKRYWEIDSNGDEILKDSPTHIVRNLSEEKRNQEYSALQEVNNGEIAYRTKQVRMVEWLNPATGYVDKQRAMIYKDLKNGNEYVRLSCIVQGEGEKEFYAFVNDPYTLARMSDRQRNIELAKKKNCKPNWIDHPEEELAFINKYNKLPIDFYGRCPIIHLENS